MNFNPVFGSSGGGGITIGGDISGGTANGVLYEDSSNQLAQSALLTFDGSSLIIGAAGEDAGLAILGHTGTTSGGINYVAQDRSIGSLPSSVPSEAIFDLTSTITATLGPVSKTWKGLDIRGGTSLSGATASYTTAATVWITGPPVAAGGATIASPYSLYIASGNLGLVGSLEFSGDDYLKLDSGSIDVYTSGSKRLGIGDSTFTLVGGVDLVMAGATSGTITHSVPDTVSSYTLTWPNDVGPGAAVYLQSDGVTGALSWAAASSSLNIGDAITGGTAGCVLYEDASNQLAEASTFNITFNNPDAGASTLAIGDIRLVSRPGLGLIQFHQKDVALGNAGFSQRSQTGQTSINGVTSCSILVNTQGIITCTSTLVQIFQSIQPSTTNITLGNTTYRFGDAYFSTGKKLYLTIGDAEYITAAVGSMDFYVASGQRMDLTATALTLNSGTSLDVAGGNATITQADATSGTPVALTITGGTHTGMTASTEVNGISLDLSNTKTWATGALTTQREILIQAPTYAFAGASNLTNATLIELSPPSEGTNATITYTNAAHVSLDSTNGTSVGSTIRGIWIDSSDSGVVITGEESYGGTLPAVAGIWIDQISLTTGGTVANVAALYIDGRITVGSGVGSITNAYGIWVDQGLCRFDGDGSNVFELPADATDPTSGGGAATGRIPVKIGGSTVYLAYY